MLINDKAQNLRGLLIFIYNYVVSLLLFLVFVFMFNLNFILPLIPP